MTKSMYGLTFDQWLVTAGFELNSPTMWPEDYEALQEEWKAGVDPFDYVTAKPKPLEDPEHD